MTTRAIRTERDLEQFVTFLRHRRLPLSVTVVDGRVRSTAQNRLQRLWCGEIAEQMGDRTPEEVRGLIKLQFGVPILRAENEDFREAYDRVIKPLPYEAKLALMVEPLDWPVTRLMNVKQMTAFMDEMQRHWSAQGVRLTDPEALKYEQEFA